MKRPAVLSLLVTAATAGATVAPWSATGATSPDRFMGELHADIVNAKGTRIAAISGNVGKAGLGWGDVVPLNAARSVGMRRPQRVRMYAMNDTTVLAVGQNGTRLRFTDRGHGQMAEGYGTLRTSPTRRVAVNANGFWDQRPFVPKRGQRMLVVGNVKGALRTALDTRYDLVKYSDGKYSRSALMKNPRLYRTVGGIVIGSGVGATRLAKLDLARSLHNDGRLVATTVRNGMLDRHMYVVSHAHTGQGGVILRREAPRLGYQVHSYPQIREPILTHSRVGGAKAKGEAATYTPAVRKRSLDAALKSVARALASAEKLAPLPKPPNKGKKKKETQSGTGSTTSDPATVTAGSDDAAFYTVPVNQYISATITAPSVFNLPSQQTYNWTTGYLQYMQPSPGTYPVTPGIPSSSSGVATAMRIISTGDFVQYGVSTPTKPPAPTGYPANACMLYYTFQFPSGTVLADVNYAAPPAGTLAAWQWACAPTPLASIWGSCTVGSWNDEVRTSNLLPNPSVAVTNAAAGTYVLAEVLWNCANFPNPTLSTATITQTAGITYNPIYTVSLAQSTSEVTTQAVTETNASQFNAVETASSPMAVGSYGSVTGLASAGTSPSTGQPESAFGLSLAYHSVVLDCSSCEGTAGGGVTPAFNSNGSSPTQQVTQVASSSATGTSTQVSESEGWSESTSSESGWSVSGNLGGFGDTGTGGVSGGYSSSTTTTDTQSGSVGVSKGTSLTSSANFTSSNWVTTPFQGKNQAAYTTYSTTVTGAGGTAANAAYSLPFPAALTGNGTSTGYIDTPSQYGGNGPGPQCTPGPACGAPALSPQPFGSNENLTGFTQGSTSFFNLDTSGNQLGTGSATPWVNDTFYLFDQGASYPGNIGSYLQLQVLGQSQVSVYQPNESGGASGAGLVSSSSGASGAEGITTYYNSQGQVVNSAGGATYASTGLDLCAPPVLTPDLWTAGCSSDPNFNGPPGVYQGAPPNITTASTANPLQYNSTTGQAEVASPAPTLTCNPGTWSGNPQFTYQWQQWNNAFGDWQVISGATGPTYTPASTLKQSTYFTCNVTGTNALGSVSEQAASVEVVVAVG